MCALGIAFGFVSCFATIVVMACLFVGADPEGDDDA